MDNLAGSHIKGYQLLERIGAGGFGAVYKAHQSTVGREVAMKIILPHYANHPDFIRRFETEAQVIARLEHLHIVPLYDYWRDSDGAYLIMRWLKGGSLKDTLSKGRFEIEATGIVLDQIASALSQAHRNNVIHRDLKPANIFMDEDGNAYLGDFGIAKDISVAQGITEVDVIVGSPDYLAPEQARSEQVTARTDIYSLGVVLYELLTGEHPFPNQNPVHVLFKHLNEPLPEITSLPDDIADKINEIIQKATAKNPLHRYADALELASAFQQVTKRSTTSQMRLVETLTRREQEILQLVMAGKSNKEIAAQLYITTTTVKWYVRQIFSKLGVRSRVQAIVRARELQLITANGGDAAALPAIPTDEFFPENPYKGLLAFQAADSQDFFGREKLIEKLVRRLSESGDFARFLAVVGPSGSGKSSLVKAGLIPAIWQGALPQSEKWFVAEMLPGAHPFDELEVVLTRIAANQSGNLREQLSRDERGLLRASQLILPDDGSELLLVIDQFEELFTLVQDEAVRVQFLKLIQTTVTDPRSRVRIVVTLRADYYDRPLHYPDFGDMLRSRMETVLPLSAHELERAITLPAERVGVHFEAGLVASIIDEIRYQAGALPLLQYALTELFEQRQGRVLTVEAYETIGRSTGALAKRADELYSHLDESGRELVRQLFLRLVTLGEGAEDTRRRVARSELLALVSDTEMMEDILDTYGEYRLLAFDHDPATREPTVEVAHEAILREWERLRQWLNESREDIRQQRQVSQTAEQWQQNQHDISYLLSGSRLEQAEKWYRTTQLVLTPLEREYMAASITERTIHRQTESERQAREIQLEQRSLKFLRGLVAVFAIAALIAISLSIFAFNQSQIADRERQQAEASTSAAQQLALVNGAQAAFANGDTDTALVLSLEGQRRQSEDTFAALTLAQAAYTPGTIRRLTGHTGRVLDVAISPNGQLAASVSESGELFLWNLQTGERLQQFAANTTTLDEITFSPDGTMILGASSDGRLILWDSASGERLQQFFGHTDWVDSIVFSQDGRRILSGADDNTMRLWDVQTGEQIRLFRGHTDWVNTVAFSPDGRVAASGSRDKTIILWDIETGSILQRFDWFMVSSIVFTGDGQKIIVAGEHPGLAIFDLTTGSLVQRLKGHSSFITNLAISPNGRFVISSSWDTTMILWDIREGQLVHRFNGHEGTVSAVAFSPDGQNVLSGSYDMTLRLWSLTDGYLEREFVPAEPLSWVLNLIFNPDSNMALSSSEDGTSVLWDVTSGQELRRFNGATTMFLPFDTISTVLVVENDAGHADAVVMNLNTGEEIRRFRVGNSARWTTALSSDGRYLALTARDGRIRVFETATGNRLPHTFSARQDLIISMTFSPDGSKLVSGARDGSVILWDVASGSVLHRFEGHADLVASVVFSADGQQVLSSSLDKSIKLWNVETGDLLRRFTHHGAASYGAVFSSDEQTIIAGLTDNTLILFDVETGQILRRYINLSASIYSLTVTSDGSHLLVGSVDGTIQLWRIDTNDELLVWSQANRYIPELTCQQRQLYRVEPLCETRE